MKFKTRKTHISKIFQNFQLLQKTLSDIHCIDSEKYHILYLLFSMTKEEMLNAIRVEMSKKSHIRSNYYMYQETFIGDVIEYIRLKNIWDINPVTDEWDYPRLPIDEQSDECIEFVYNLIKK